MVPQVLPAAAVQSTPLGPHHCIGQMGARVLGSNGQQGLMQPGKPPPTKLPLRLKTPPPVSVTQSVRDGTWLLVCLAGQERFLLLLLYQLWCSMVC